jgi:Ty3 transposon capsid-like protein
MQFQALANEWYDGYLLEHDPPDWVELVRLVTTRFKIVLGKNSLDELRSLHQDGSVEEYWVNFEKLRSKMILEGRQFSVKDFMVVFINGLRGDIKPFVQVFRPQSLKEAYEYAIHMKSATENQLKRFKLTAKANIVLNT